MPYKETTWWEKMNLTGAMMDEPKLLEYREEMWKRAVPALDICSAKSGELPTTDEALSHAMTANASMLLNGTSTLSSDAQSYDPRRFYRSASVYFGDEATVKNFGQSKRLGWRAAHAYNTTFVKTGSFEAAARAAYVVEPLLMFLAYFEGVA